MNNPQPTRMFYRFVVGCIILSTSTSCFGQTFNLSASAITTYLPSTPWQRGVSGGLLWADTTGCWLAQAEYGHLEGKALFKEKGYELRDKTNLITLRIAHGVARKGPQALYLGMRADIARSHRALIGHELGWLSRSDASGGGIALSLLWRWRFSRLGSLHAFVDTGYLYVYDSETMYQAINEHPLGSSFQMVFGLGASIAFL